METYIQIIVIIFFFIAAAWYLYRRFKNLFNPDQPSCGCGCSGCGSDQSKDSGMGRQGNKDNSGSVP